MSEDMLVLDETAIEKLREMGFHTGEPGFAREVAGDYLRGVDQLLDAMAQALDLGDCEAASRAAHTLMGRSGVLGAARLSALAAEIERAAESGQIADARRHLSALPAAREAIAAALDAYWARIG